MDLQKGLTELFEPEDFLERIQCIGMEQNKSVESQVRIVATIMTSCLPVVYIFPDFSEMFCWVRWQRWE